jgi:hypothetical protein
MEKPFEDINICLFFDDYERLKEKDNILKRTLSDKTIK